MNDFQLRKSKNKEVTGKITTQAIINQQQILPQRNPYQHPGNHQYEPQANDCIDSPIQTSKFSMRIQTSLARSWKK